MIAGLALTGFAGAASADSNPRSADAKPQAANGPIVSDDGYDYDTMPLPMRWPGSSAPPLESGEKPTEPQLVAEDMGISPEQEQAMLDQVPLFELNAEAAMISAALPGDPATASTFDVPNKTLILYWYGEVPAEIFELRESAEARGCKVTVLPSAYSRAQLKAGAEEITGRSGGPAGLSVRLNNDGSGLTVMYPGLDGVRVSADGSTKFDANEAILTAIDSVIESGMTVVIGESEGEGAVPFGRANDVGRQVLSGL